MKSSKERKMDKKRRAQETNARKSALSRQRRLDNKARRTEIIAINSHAKIKIIDQDTYVDGVKVEVVNNKIVPVEPETVVAADEGEVNVMETPTVEVVDTKNVSKLRSIFKKW